jgi:hypothetical protein
MVEEFAPVNLQLDGLDYGIFDSFTYFFHGLSPYLVASV